MLAVCPDCAGSGWYVRQTGPEEGEQTQCATCHGEGRITGDGSDGITSAEIAIAELVRAHWAIENKKWMNARVYINQARIWTEKAEKEDDTATANVPREG